MESGVLLGLGPPHTLLQGRASALCGAPFLADILYLQGRTIAPTVTLKELDVNHLFKNRIRFLNVLQTGSFWGNVQ